MTLLLGPDGVWWAEAARGVGVPKRSGSARAAGRRTAPGGAQWRGGGCLVLEWFAWCFQKPSTEEDQKLFENDLSLSIRYCLMNCCGFASENVL